MAKFKKSTGDKLVDEIMAKFSYSYLATLPNFERMDRIQNSYGNQISTLSWPTISNCSIPLTFMAVEEQLGPAMSYLFPKNRSVNLIPTKKMDREIVQRVEDGLRYTVKTEMSLEVAAFPSIKDCYKFAVGYGLIDTEYITPPEVRVLEAEQDGKLIKKINQLQIGKQKQLPSYVYTPTICVIPVPGGANVEGPNRAPGHFVIVFKSESAFRDMFNEKGIDDKPILKGDVDQIIQEARSLSFDYRLPQIDLIQNLANLELTRMNNGDKRMPVMIPIVRYYEDHHQVWIANGRHKIYEVKNKYQALRSDLVKWSAWPDGNDWFPLGVTEASEKVALGTNLWYNGLIDLAMYHINPVRIINSRVVDDPRNVSRSPRSDVVVSGDATQAMSYMKLPEFPSSLLNMGEVFQRFHANSNGITTGAQDKPAGLVRGGSNALEQFMASTTGRQALASIMLKTGGLKSVYEKTLIKKQLLIPEEGEMFVEPAVDPGTGKEIYKETTVTVNEIRNVFRCELNFPEARANEMGDFSRRTSFFDRAQKNPELFDQRKLYEYIEEDEAAVARMMLPESVVKERQDRIAEASMQAKEAAAMQGQPQGQPEAPPAQGEQAAAGTLAGQV